MANEPDDQAKLVIDLSQRVGAMLVNYMQASVGPDVARLVFFELFATGAVEVRTAVCMRTPDLVLMHKVLGDLIQQATGHTGKVH